MPYPVTADFHTHTDSSPDSQAPVEAMCRAAVDRGLTALAITDHVEMVSFLDDGYDRLSARSYRKAVEAQQRFQGKLRIAAGVELGEPIYNMEETRRLLSTHPYDFILGSMHSLGDGQDFYFYDYSKADIPSVLDAYFQGVLELVRWGGFHSLAHLTYPLRYMPTERRPETLTPWQEVIDEIFTLMAGNGLALEINTSGLRGPIGMTSPDLTLIRRFRELGGENITLGSDAHRPEDVGAGLETAASLAIEAGFRYCCLYFEGKPERVRLV